MGSVDTGFATALQARLGLRRAVETGTYLGHTAHKLAKLFAQVTTIEASPELHAKASQALEDAPNVTALQGHSVDRLAELPLDVPTLYFLDGHWSGGMTSGEDEDCPVLRELAAIGAGHPDDCLIIDDARMFATAPPPPAQASHWPDLITVIDLIRELRPDHLVTLVDDQVIAVPVAARQALNEYGWRTQNTPAARARAAAAAVRSRILRRVAARA